VLPFDPSKQVNPTFLRIGYFDTNNRTWKYLPNNAVIDWVNHTISNTTTFVNTYFAVINLAPMVQESPIQDVVATVSPTIVKPSEIKPSLQDQQSPTQRKPTACFLWWCKK
jgi:hypothetical protein